jgi:small-conductance mechanosensitive channel
MEGLDASGPGWTSAAGLLAIARALLLLAFGAFAARTLGRLVHRSVVDRLGAHSAALLRRAIFYAVLAIFSIVALRELGFDLSVLLGAAGILTIAIGFASQTSAANVVSGLFLIGERPFGLGDVIRVGSTTGEVLSIDMLSVKLRTFDNLMVRVPNETLIKSEITNLTRFDVRRIDLLISVAYKEDLERVSELLLEIADAHPLALEEPRPLVILTGFGDSGVSIQFSVWGARANFLELRNGLFTRIHAGFRDAGVEIPFPQVALHAGSDSRAIGVDLRGS